MPWPAGNMSRQSSRTRVIWAELAHVTIHARSSHVDSVDVSYPALNVILSRRSQKAATITAPSHKLTSRPGSQPSLAAPYIRLASDGKLSQCEEILVPAACTLHRNALSVDEESPHSLTCSSLSQSPPYPLSPQLHRRLSPSPDRIRSLVWDQPDISIATRKDKYELEGGRGTARGRTWYRKMRNTTSSRKHANRCKMGILMQNL